MAEELWELLGHGKTLAYEPWPTFDETAIRESSVEIPVQILGKVRGRVVVPADADEKAIEAAATLAGDDPTALTAIGAAISQCLEDLPRAAAYIDSALALDPNNAWAWARSAWVAIYQDEPDWARERFERSLALSPLDPLAFNLRIGIAMTYGYQGDYVHSAKLLQDVLKKHPRVTWAYRQLAFASAMSGDLPTACDAIAKLRAAHPNATITQMKKAHPSRHTPRVFILMVDAWRRAGLPEK